MTDVVMVAITVAFFAACVAYVGLCDRIVGADPPPADAHDASDPSDAEWKTLRGREAIR